MRNVPRKTKKSNGSRDERTLKRKYEKGSTDKRTAKIKYVAGSTDKQFYVRFYVHFYVKFMCAFLPRAHASLTQARWYFFVILTKAGCLSAISFF